MARYRYRALDGAGREVSGTVDATDHRGAVVVVERLGNLALEVTRSDGSSVSGFDLKSFLTLENPRREVTHFLSELGHILRAGLRLDEALELLQEEFVAGRVAELVTHLRASLAAGNTLADGLRARPALIPPQVVAMIEVSELTGTLPTVVTAIAAGREREEALRNKVAGALRYPLFLVAMAAAVLLFILLFVMPNFAQVFAGQTDKLPAGPALLFALSGWLTDNRDLALGGLAVIVVGIFALVRLPATRRAARRAAERVPGLRDLFVYARTASFARQLALLLGNGVQLLVAVDLIARSGMADLDLQAVGRSLRRGEGLAGPLRQSAFLPPAAVRMLKVGEESGNLAAMAGHIADIYELKLADGLGRVVGIVGPAAILAIGLLVASIFASVLTALVSINDLAV
jgi:general secretion pathway protein F